MERVALLLPAAHNCRRLCALPACLMQGIGDPWLWGPQVVGCTKGGIEGAACFELCSSCRQSQRRLGSSHLPTPTVQVAHTWRTTFDIHASWVSVLQNLDESVGLARYGGPGSWGDLDMLEVCRGLHCVAWMQGGR